MQKRLKILLVALFASLVISNVFFTYNYIVNLRTLEQMTKKQEINANVLSFTQLFLEKVLRGGTLVSFDDRLHLENSVRALNDKDIFASWESFTNAKSQTEVQQDFYTLFDLLLKRISF